MKAIEKDTDRAAWELWLTFDGKAKSETPFNKFLQKIKEPQREKDNRSDDEVIQDAEDILKMMKRT
ncbi:hypothetical protein [Mesobacillus subterraneus]|uniref:hypothetical protein n=1 Tax=Mesobacillus subterraneus TaxID=285983 RepID=UPI00203CB649|nr:hypothetical protein [Mesobacillus subterraneus]MCM3686067.1 hypothetical protein [Mesobacillus subterraneus]